MSVIFIMKLCHVNKGVTDESYTCVDSRFHELEETLLSFDSRRAISVLPNTEL